MNDQKKLGKLLEKERDALDLTLTEVAREIGFNHYQTLSSIESGERDIKAWELAKLAGVYGRDLDYFLKSEQPKETRILWRSPEESAQKKLMGSKFLSICRRYQNLIQLLGEKEKIKRTVKLSVDKHDLLLNAAYENVEALAAEYCKHLNLGSRPACSLTKVLEEEMGIKVIFLPIESDISGGSAKDDEFGMAILINSNDAPWRRNYDLAHEFFHILTWDYFAPEEIYSDNAGKKSRVEQMADVFASSLLLPEKEIREEFDKKKDGKKISYLDLIDIARDFNVSLEALLWRLVNLGLLKKQNILKVLEKGTILDVDKKHHRRDWAENQSPYISSRYISLAIKAYHLGKISKGKLAEYLNEKYSAVSSFLEKYGYDEEEDYSVAYRTS